MKNFNEIYQKTYQDVKAIISQNPKKPFLESKAFKIALIIGVLVLLVAIGFNFLPLIFIYMICAALFIFIFTQSEKDKEYKNTVIAALVKNYDNNLHYNITGSVPRHIYNQGEFEYYELYHSEDGIQGMLDGIMPFNMSNILTQTESTDSDGNTTYYTVFSGLFAEVTLNKRLNLKLLIHSDKGVLGKLFKGSNRVNMDSQEFEKIFDVTASDKIQAMQLLTADVMADLIDFKEKSKRRFEMTIKGNKLYFRFHCGNVFERAAFKDDLDFKTLLNYFTYLDFCCEVSKKIYNLVQDTDL